MEVVSPKLPAKTTVSGSLEKLQKPDLALSFDDVLLEPGYSQVLPADCSVATKVGRLNLQIPLLSAAMDTVTESEAAIAMALSGGIGVLHKNLNIEEQAQEVRRVKKFQHAVILSPLTVEPSDSIKQVRDLIQSSGIKGFPVVDDEGVLVGICTTRDIRYITDEKLRVRDIMTKTVHCLEEGVSPDAAVEFFRQYKVEKLPLIDSKGRLKGLMTSRDFRQTKSHPMAVRDEKGSLRVAAAVGAGPIEGIERGEALVAAGVDCLVIDSAHGHSDGVMLTLRELRRKFKDLILIAGNIATPQAAEDLIKAGADILKVGIGPGSICTTRVVSGVGVPQFTAVAETAHFVRQNHPEVGVIADGGVRYSGDITKALAAGAHAVMIGSLFAGTDESPGEIVLFQGRSYKLYRGMGSLSAMKRGSKDRYRQGTVDDAKKLVPEGVEARVPYRGPISQVIHQMLGGLKAGMGYVGAKNLDELLEKARFRRMTPGGLKESHVHDVNVTAEAPNYSAGASD